MRGLAESRTAEHIAAVGEEILLPLILYKFSAVITYKGLVCETVCIMIQQSKDDVQLRRVKS